MTTACGLAKKTLEVLMLLASCGTSVECFIGRQETPQETQPKTLQIKHSKTQIVAYIQQSFILLVN